jgi:hypothetical protein
MAYGNNPARHGMGTAWHGMRELAFILPSVACPALTSFSTLSYKRQIF